VEDLRTTLAEVGAASEQLMATAAKLTDDDLREPSRLPGWTRAHVLAHLIRNTDSCWNLLEWARTGVEVPQYPSNEAREAGIEANARRPIAELRTELRIAIERLALQATTMPEEAWSHMVSARLGWPHPAWYVLNRRWRELQAHHLDLNVGYTFRDWPLAYVRWELAETLGAIARDGGLAGVGRVRATDLDTDVVIGDGPEISGTGHELLGWLTGRGDATPGGWPDPPAWPPQGSAWETR
jgi:uncharacterized protein (TIGR03083 family)